MPVNVRAWIMATGLVWFVLYTLCALWVAVSPGGFMATLGYLTHIDLTPLARTLTWPSFLAGLVAWTVVPALAAGAFAGTYNFLSRRESAPLSVSMLREAERERVRR